MADEKIIQCPGCGENIPDHWSQHFKCGWIKPTAGPINIGPEKPDFSEIIDMLKNIQSRLDVVEKRLGDYNGDLTAFNLNLLNIGKFLQERLKK